MIILLLIDNMIMPYRNLRSDSLVIKQDIVDFKDDIIILVGNPRSDSVMIK